jgi:internalin A
MNSDNGYHYDVFLSYRRAADWPRFVDKNFLPMFQHWLGVELGRGPRIYYDKNAIEAGQSWPRQAADGLAHSKVMVCLWSREYFSSEWCRRELSQMLARRELTSRELTRGSFPPNLIIAAILHDSEHLDPRLDDIERFDIREYANPWIADGSPRHERLSEQLARLSVSVAQALDKAPEYNPAWSDLDQLPDELLVDYGEQRTVPRLLDYFDRTRQGARPLNEAKLIILGWGGVGKTSLINRLVHQRFDPAEPRTEGIEVTSWPITLANDERVRLNAWDFGGQEIMHATHRFFLTSRSLHLIVLNGRAGSADADADYWLRIVGSIGPNSPVIVALNKVKKEPFEVDEASLRRKFPNIRAFVSTDCAAGDNGFGIDELLSAIRDATDNLADLRVEFPTAWFEIKDRLAGMSENYLTFERYREICADLGEEDNRAQEKLAGYLNSLGIALNYRDDPRLRDTHVLNPHWVTEGIYAILNSRLIAERHGEVSGSDLAHILDPRQYPAERYTFLLDLMRRFELCFPYLDEPDKYLVADLLPKQQPDAATAFPIEESLKFEYRYPVLPEGLLPRFIVRSNIHSTAEPRWRNGALLRWERGYALVQADIPDRLVRIFVTGPSESRLRLLAVIRSDFELIHNSYRFKVSPFVPVENHPGLAVEYDSLLAAAGAGMPSFPVFFADRFVEIDVNELLEGVDLDILSQRRGSGIEDIHRERPVRMFVSYSHRDERHRQTLESYLKLLNFAGLLSIWHDRQIDAGDDWKGKIDQALEEADVVVLLVSVDFLGSEYINDVELKRALERHADGTCKVVPVIVRDAPWGLSRISGLQALPTDGRAITTWSNRDTAWRVVAEGLERVIRTLQSSPS